MKKIFIFIWFFILTDIHVMACLNGYEVIPGIEKYDELEYEIKEVEVYFNSLQQYKNEQLKDFERNGKKEHVDLVIALLYLHDYRTALSVAEKLNRKFPSEYNVVITYAATLELNGKLNEALIFINKAIEINPKSHEGSEWMHVKIIEDLMGLNKNPFSVVGIETGSDSIPVFVENGKVDKLTLLYQLAFQISERKYFIPGNDPAFGKLIFDYANLLYLNDYISKSEYYFEMAINYGFDIELSQSRYTYVRNWVKKKYHSEVEVKPQKKEDSRKEERTGNFSWKKILRDTIPIVILLGLLFFFWYRAKFYHDNRKK